MLRNELEEDRENSQCVMGLRITEYFCSMLIDQRNALAPDSPIKKPIEREIIDYDQFYFILKHISDVDSPKQKAITEGSTIGAFKKKLPNELSRMIGSFLRFKKEGITLAITCKSAMEHAEIRLKKMM